MGYTQLCPSLTSGAPVEFKSQALKSQHKWLMYRSFRGKR
jgi:hypothetical protein